jgi:peptide deformylase
MDNTILPEKQMDNEFFPKTLSDGSPNLGLTLYPDARLTTSTKDIANFGAHWLPIAESMSRLMITLDGVGLAGPQAGIGHSIICYKVDGYEGYMLNPKILESSVEVMPSEEGCLSFPGVKIVVTRPASIKVQYQDYEGTVNELEATGLLAKVLQHEIDHLHGKLFTKNLSSLKKDIVHRKMVKFKKEVTQRREKLNKLVKQMTKNNPVEQTGYDFNLKAEEV